MKSTNIIVFETPLTIAKFYRYKSSISLNHIKLDFSGLLIFACTTSDSERMIFMERLDAEVQYRTAYEILSI